MWLEIKAVMTVIGITIIFVAFGAASDSIIGLVLCMMGIGTIIFGDIIIGWRITSTKLKIKLDPTPPGYEQMNLYELNGKEHFINTRKGPEGIRKFVFNGLDCTVINDGTSQFVSSNGNRGFIAHESYDRNINLKIAKALEQISTKLKLNSSADVKEIYTRLNEEIEKLKGDKTNVKTI
jgi:hypothetical protein